MKIKLFYWAITLCLMTGNALAQSGLSQIQPIADADILPAYPVKAGWDHTTVLVFPAEVVSVDRGHGMLLSQKEEKAPNLLKLKAGRRGFPTTNLHVVTSDARLYHFRVAYGESLSGSTLRVGEPSMPGQSKVLLRDWPMDTSEIKRNAERVVEEGGFLNRSERGYRMKMRLSGIYGKDRILFFKIELKNRSKFPFEPQEIAFKVTDRKQAKRTSVREESLVPLLMEWQKEKGVPGEGENTLVLAFDRFTLSDKKILTVSLSEKDGDRRLCLKVRSRDILKVRNLADFEPTK